MGNFKCTTYEMHTNMYGINWTYNINNFHNLIREIPPPSPPTKNACLNASSKLSSKCVHNHLDLNVTLPKMIWYKSKKKIWIEIKAILPLPLSEKKMNKENSDNKQTNERERERGGREGERGWVSERKITTDD